MFNLNRKKQVPTSNKYLNDEKVLIFPKHLHSDGDEFDRCLHTQLATYMRI